MTKTEIERLAVVENEITHLRNDVADIKMIVTAMHAKSLEEKGSKKTRGAIFWGSVGFVAYIGSNLNAILSFFKGA